MCYVHTFIFLKNVYMWIPILPMRKEQNNLVHVCSQKPRLQTNLKWYALFTVWNSRSRKKKTRRWRTKTCRRNCKEIASQVTRWTGRWQSVTWTNFTRHLCSLSTLGRYCDLANLISSGVCVCVCYHLFLLIWYSDVPNLIKAHNLFLWADFCSAWFFLLFCMIFSNAFGSIKVGHEPFLHHPWFLRARNQKVLDELRVCASNSFP